MKSNIILASVLATFMLACQPTIDQQIKEKKTEIASLKNELKELQDQLPKDSTKVSKIAVNTQAVEQQDFESFFHVHGVVATNQNITVNPEFSGTIKQIKVREGQKVSKGAVIAILDTDLIQRQISEVQKGLEFANQVFEKQENLQKKNVGTEIQYLEAKNRKESLEKTLESLRAQLQKAYVKAPISGTVDEIFAHVGELASPQMPLARMVNVSDVFVKADISEVNLGKVKNGDKVMVSFSSLDHEEVEGKVSYVGKFINSMNRTFLIHVDISNKKGIFLPNLLSVVKIRNEFAKDAVVVPTKVLQDDGKHIYVFTVENGIAHKKNLTIGNSYDGNTVVLSGLKANEQVVVKGQTMIVEGSAVEVK